MNNERLLTEPIFEDTTQVEGPVKVPIYEEIGTCLERGIEDTQALKGRYAACRW
ncbi:MAG: hypothetical protein JSS14_23275 [Proteobacteria bacterium]|nr:hypothetical protein [Pseudomonadota bacterium]